MRTALSVTILGIGIGMGLAAGSLIGCSVLSSSLGGQAGSFELEPGELRELMQPGADERTEDAQASASPLPLRRLAVVTLEGPRGPWSDVYGAELRRCGVRLRAAGVIEELVPIRASGRVPCETAEGGRECRIRILEAERDAALRRGADGLLLVNHSAPAQGRWFGLPWPFSRDLDGSRGYLAEGGILRLGESSSWLTYEEGESEPLRDWLQKKQKTGQRINTLELGAQALRSLCQAMQFALSEQIAAERALRERLRALKVEQERQRGERDVRIEPPVSSPGDAQGPAAPEPPR
jgi:hypothetical protein